jgi:integrase
VVKIFLRQKKLLDGRKSIYLDMYRQGHRRYEFLNLYLTGNRDADKETMRLAEAIVAKRKLASVSADHDLPAPSRLQEDFVAYCRRLAEDQQAHNTRLVWNNAIARLVSYAGPVISFGQLSEDFIKGFRENLLKDLKRNSAAVYFAKIKTAIRRATRKHILRRNPADGITIRTEETSRLYLTLADLRCLQKTDCENQAVKDAFLFSAFSGMRYSDVKRLTWGKIESEDNRWRIGFVQQKTGSLEWLPLSAEAVSILRHQKDARPSGRTENPIPADAVFKLPAQQTIDKAIKRWAVRAGLERRISFHTARHTFGTLGLKHGIDIYTMSKLLGHRSLETTQIYAKVVDESKRKAVALFPTLHPSDSKRKSRKGK